MEYIEIFTAVVSCCLLVYLFIALLKPEILG